MDALNDSNGKASSRFRLDFNSPVILSITCISLLLLFINWISGGAANRFLAIRYTSWADPLMYIRLFTHVLAHSGMAHFTGNFMLILAVGPMVEEKYGGGRLLVMIAITSAVTGLVNVIFFRDVALIGASGVVFMLILLASFVNIRQGRIPLTVLLVAVLYIGNEVVQGVIADDNISQMAHIVGGLCGSVFGFSMHRGRKH